jgi:hypothetical protein
MRGGGEDAMGFTLLIVVFMTMAPRRLRSGDIRDFETGPKGRLKM